METLRAGSRTSEHRSSCKGAAHRGGVLVAWAD